MVLKNGSDHKGSLSKSWHACLYNTKTPGTSACFLIDSSNKGSVSNMTSNQTFLLRFISQGDIRAFSTANNHKQQYPCLRKTSKCLYPRSEFSNPGMQQRGRLGRKQSTKPTVCVAKVYTHSKFADIQATGKAVIKFAACLHSHLRLSFYTSFNGHFGDETRQEWWLHLRQHRVLASCQRLDNGVRYLS